MRKMSFYNKDKNKSTLNSLSQALGNRDKTNINTGSIATPPQQQQKEDDVWGGANSFLQNGLKLGQTVYDNFGNSGTSGSFGGDYGIFGNAANNYINGVNTTDYGAFGNAANNFISSGVSTDGSAIGNAIGSEVGSGFGGSGAGGFMPYMGLAMGGLRAGESAFDGGSWGEDVPQSFFGIDDENDSDVMQAIKGTTQGASMGAGFGPWGAVIGGILGLGASFLDDF